MQWGRTNEGVVCSGCKRWQANANACKPLCKHLGKRWATVANFFNFSATLRKRLGSDMQTLCKLLGKSEKNVTIITLHQ
jgi:hypothetical protein